MNNELVPQQGGYLALNDDDFLSRLTNVAEGLKGGGSFAFLKMDGNTGQYCYGADDIELTIGSTLALDWRSFRRGWIIWVGGQVEHEVMVDPVYEAPPSKQSLPDHGPYGKEDGPREQQSIQFKLLEEPFTEMVFQANNKSKINALGALMKDFVRSFKSHPGMSPVVEIDSNSFEAKDPENPKRKFKKFAPKFKIVDWISGDELNAMNEGNPEDYEQAAPAALPAPEPTPAPAPARAPAPRSVARPAPAQRPAAAAPVAAEPAPVEPASAAAPAAAPQQAAAPAARRGRF